MSRMTCAHIVDGKLLRMFGTVRNVAKHRRREAVLTERLKMLEGLVAAVPVPVVAIDPSGIIEEVNVAAAQWLGRPSDLLLGHTLEQALNDTPFSGSLPAASNAIYQAATLGVTATFRAPENNPTRIWHVAPRETSLYQVP
jgi:PAS domain-containing protein